jgi:hypothetical protein
MIAHRKIALIITQILLVALFLIKILPLFLPIKYALKELPKSTGEYWIVKGVKVTGYAYYTIGDENGLYSDLSHGRYINIIENEPFSTFNDTYDPGNNRFICYGEIVYAPLNNVPIQDPVPRRLLNMC